MSSKDEAREEVIDMLCEDCNTHHQNHKCKQKPGNSDKCYGYLVDGILNKLTSLGYRQVSSELTLISGEEIFNLAFATPYKSMSAELSAYESGVGIGAQAQLDADKDKLKE